MTAPTFALARPVLIARVGSRFRLSFRYDPKLVELVKALPYAQFEPDSKSWSVLVCDQAVQALRRMHYEGLTDIAVDDLLEPNERPAPCRAALLREGTVKRPFVVHIGLRGDGTYEKLSSLPGATWDKKSQSLTYPPLAAVALAEFVSRGLLDDPEKILSPADTVVAFDTRTGAFSVRGPDSRAAAAFNKFFPQRDVVKAWTENGLDVAFADPFTEEVYRGELARVAPLDTLTVPRLTVDMFEYQRRNVAVAMQRTGFAILDEPGLGKTVQAIAVGAGHLASGAVPRVCVLVPSSVRSQWASEIARFTGTPTSNVVVVRGDPKRRMAAYRAARTAQWLIVHYDILARDIKLLKPLFAGALVVADEAHRLKSYKSARTDAALSLCRSAGRRLALSGTPLETHVGEWYQVLSGFAVPGFLGAPRDFNSRYRYETKFGFEGARNLRELRDRSKVHFGRFTKAQVARHLPPLRVDQLILDTDPAYAGVLRRAHQEAAGEIQKLYDANRGTKDPVIKGGLFGEDREDEVGGAEMNAVGQLRLMCASPRLVVAARSESASAMVAAGLVPDVDGPKLDELRVMAADFRSISDARKLSMPEGTIPTPKDVQPERFVVFSSFKMMVNLIAARFDEDGIPYVLFTGDSTPDQRDAAVAAFTDPSSDVLAFLATDAASEGLNLGRCCSTLIQFDPPWTPSRSQQRVNRIHRIDGTSSRYQVINLVLAGTLEGGIYRLLAQRADVQDVLLDESNTRYKATGRRTRPRTVFEEAMEQYSWKGQQPHARAPRTERSGRVADTGAMDAGVRVSQQVDPPSPEPMDYASIEVPTLFD